MCVAGSLARMQFSMCGIDSSVCDRVITQVSGEGRNVCGRVAQVQFSMCDAGRNMFGGVSLFK